MARSGGRLRRAWRRSRQEAGGSAFGAWGFILASIDDYGGPRPAGRYLGESGLEATLARDSWYVTVMLWRLEDFVKSKDVDCWIWWKSKIKLGLLDFTGSTAPREIWEGRAAS
jgi:hypothetical protein